MKQGFKFKGFGLVLLICLLVYFPASVFAAVYYVDSVNGNDGNEGLTSGTAWKKLHYAIDQISNFDTLNVAPGTYSVLANGEDDTPLTIIQSNVTIQGAAGGTTIVEGSSCASWSPGIEIASPASNVTIRNLVVRKFTCEGGVPGIAISSGDGNIIEDCEIYNNEDGIYVSDGSPEIRKNRIYNNETGIFVIGFSGPASPSICNNLIYDTSGTMSDGIWVSAGSLVASPSIRHNTIDGGTSVGITTTSGGGSGTPIIEYNIITNFGMYGIDDSLGSNIDYNDVWNNTAGNYSGTTTAGPNDLNSPVGENPRYALDGSYKLQSDSPCIDAIPLAAADTTIKDDIDGNPRHQGSGYDMGAYEYTVSTAQTVPIPPGTQVADYRMVAFTVQPSDPACTSVFGDEMGGAYNPANFKIGTYDPTTGSYVECDSGLDIVPGKAYWILARNGFDATVHGTPASMSDTDVALDYNATTGNGWNQIGCPNAANYWWDEVEVFQDGSRIGTTGEAVTDDYIDKRLWCWENGSYYADNVEMLQREGYWVKAKMANVSLRFLQSAQTTLAQVSNQDIMFAGLFKKAKKWVNKWILGSQIAIADSGDSPPMPMAAISGSSADSEGGGGGGCFVDSLQ
jgi:parallel beta-helix repeat protein